MSSDPDSTLVVCEDDPLTLEMLSDNLTADRFRVLEASSGKDALRLVRYHQPDLLLLDLGLPDITGLAVLRTIRDDPEAGVSNPDLPVILISGFGTENDRVRCLEDGADDFVMKPIDYRELLARIRAVLRRSEQSSRNRLNVAGICIDQATRRVTVDGREVRLNRKEFQLLCTLAQDPDRVYTKQELMREVWGHEPWMRSRTLESHASRLRQKLDPVGRRFVVNDWGVGYRLLP
jgi:DNA-binding response OmpR family regulator